MRRVSVAYERKAKAARLDEAIAKNLRELGDVALNLA